MMQTRPTHRLPQTSKQVKAEYKRCGPRISSQESRQLERGAELYRRAEKIKENEKRREASKKKKLEKENRERDARQRVGLPSPKVIVSGSQSVLEGFMRITNVNNEHLKASAENEPWADEKLDDAALLGIIAQSSPSRSLCAHEERVGSDDSTSSSNSILRLELADAWEDLLMSDTQIERELALENNKAAPISAAPVDPFLSLLSTQDVSFTEEDLAELGVEKRRPDLGRGAAQSHTISKHDRDRELMPPPSLPVKKAATASPEGMSTEQDWWSADFCLSTQELRDVTF